LPKATIALVTRYSLLVTLSVVALLDKQQEIFIFKNSLHSDKLQLQQPYRVDLSGDFKNIESN